MRILIFGAAGSVGSRIVAEALARGHQLTAVVRRQDQLSSLPAGVQGRVGDATRLDEVIALSAGHDLVIGATRPAAGSEQDLVLTARALLAGARQTGARLILVGGAASLRVPDTGKLVVDDPRYTPPAIRAIVEACHMQHEACIADANTDWTYLSPPALLLPGVRTGRYEPGSDELLFDAGGVSTISVEDFAVALLDEAESPAHRGSRFTVAARALAVSDADVMVQTPDGVADCYLAHPAEGSWPPVILWPDAVGLRSAYRTIGRRLAGAGYSVLVVNPFYRTLAAPLDVDMDSFYQPAGREWVMALARAVTPEMVMTDTAAFVDYLDRHPSVDVGRKAAAIGYCIGGAKAVRSAAARPDRIGAVAAFHGAGLITDQDDSPHRLLSGTKARALVAIAEDDDSKAPSAKGSLREAWDATGLLAEIEVFAGAMHGWCVPDARAYDPVHAERAWSRLAVLLAGALG